MIFPIRAKNFSACKLRLLVHSRAFFHQPLSYAQAIFWRLKGLRLRSQHRFATLTGQVRGAYSLWTKTRERQFFNSPLEHSVPFGTPLDVVVDARCNTDNVALSISSVFAAHQSHLGRIYVLGDVPNELLPTPVTALAHPEELWNLAAKRALIHVIAGDTVAPQVFEIYSRARSENPEAILFYADDDLIDSRGKRHSPHFKPKWNSELFRHLDYISGSSLHVLDTNPVGKKWPPAPDARKPPVHVPHVLHHRASRPLPKLLKTPLGQGPLPHVSVIIPTRNEASLLKTCLEGLRKTKYHSFDITVIDNGSTEKSAIDFLNKARASGVNIIHDPREFNYAQMHNDVVPSVKGPVLCLLNNDIEMLDGDWLTSMVAHAVNPSIGAVGALLLYPDRTIQHAGIVIGIGGGAAHAHRRMNPTRLARGEIPGDLADPVGRPLIPQFVTAVTGACLVVEKHKFLAVGGFDSERFAVAFNDVDLCLKLNEKKWQSFYEPRAVLIHHESKTRGRDVSGKKKMRFASELAYLKERWMTDRVTDPFHHPELSKFSESFVVRL